MEFADYREYTHGDDLRQIDWNVYDAPTASTSSSARTRRAHCARPGGLLQEHGLGRHNKLDYARRLAALGTPPRASQDRVQVAGFHERLLAPLPALREGRRGACSASSPAPSRGADRHPAAPRAYASMHRRSGMAVLISDFLNPGGLEGLTALLDRGSRPS